MTETLAVDVKNLTVKFGDFTAVNDITFSVKTGEIFGFLGANGAGKTTTIRVLCGLLIPTHGDVKLAGIDVGTSPQEIKARVGYMSQRFTLYNDMTVDENLAFSASLRKLSPAFFKQRREELFNFISFTRSGKSMVQDLPGGLKQQVALIASLLHDPQVVFLDEPTAGVTPASRARFWALIKRLSERGKTVFVTTHYMDEAEQCQRIALMREGKIIALDSPGGLKHSTFKGQMLELEPVETPTYEEIQTLQKNPMFSLIEPYGLRFHASIGDAQAWQSQRAQFEKKFRIRPIEPSLEDVFIRLVEGGPK